MELGNLIFGNSRGNYPIERGEGWEEHLGRLFDSFAPSRDNSWREYGVPFENDTFVVRPYYWGDCDCGFDGKEFGQDHTQDCYQTPYRKIYERHRGKPFGSDKKDVRTLCAEYKLSYPYGCAVHCTCDYSERYQKWLNEVGYPDGCKDTCSTRLPNFHYKPTDFRIEWYKYPLRDSYKNQDITLAQFEDIINKCIESQRVNEDTDTGRNERLSSIIHHP